MCVDISQWFKQISVLNIISMKISTINSRLHPLRRRKCIYRKDFISLHYIISHLWWYFVWIRTKYFQWIKIVTNFFQIDLIGQNIFDYSHPCDHEEIRELFSDKAKDDGNDSQKSLFIRLKCTLTSKGRSVNLKSATYKVFLIIINLNVCLFVFIVIAISSERLNFETSTMISKTQIIGRKTSWTWFKILFCFQVLHLKGHMIRSQPDKSEVDSKLKNCFAAIANPIPHPSNIEAPLPKQTFVTKHSLDMKFIHADDKM